MKTQTFNSFGSMLTAIGSTFRAKKFLACVHMHVVEMWHTWITTAQIEGSKGKWHLLARRDVCAESVDRNGREAIFHFFMATVKK